MSIGSIPRNGVGVHYRICYMVQGSCEICAKQTDDWFWRASGFSGSANRLRIDFS